MVVGRGGERRTGHHPGGGDSGGEENCDATLHAHDPSPSKCARKRFPDCYVKTPWATSSREASIMRPRNGGGDSSRKRPRGPVLRCCGVMGGHVERRGGDAPRGLGRVGVVQPLAVVGQLAGGHDQRAPGRSGPVKSLRQAAKVSAASAARGGSAVSRVAPKPGGDE